MTRVLRILGPAIAAVIVAATFGIAPRSAFVTPAAAEESVFQFMRKDAERRGVIRRPARGTNLFGSNRRTRTYYALPNQGGDLFGAPPTESASRASIRKQKLRGQDEDGETPDSLASTTTYCVRTCDGYFFPIGTPAGGADVEAQELVCKSLCPATETRLYVAAGGSDGIEDAVSHGKRYIALPTAFRFQRELDKACTCNPAGRGLAGIGVLEDFTMKAGDVVMTADGLKVLSKTRRYPYREQSFVPATWSKQLTAGERDRLRGLENGGRSAKVTGADKKQLAKNQALLDSLEPEDGAQATDPQSLVRYLADEDQGAPETAQADALSAEQ
jgi:hypothetical protein